MGRRKLKRGGLLTVAVTFLMILLAFGAGSALAATEAIGTLGAIVGKAVIKRGNEAIPAKKGMEIFETDRLQTEARTVVKISFTDGSSFMAFQDSELSISEYKVKAGGGDSMTVKSALDIAKGKVRFFVKPQPKGSVDVKFKTANAVMGIRGTSGLIDASQPGKTQLVLLTGKVEVSNPRVPGARVMVRPNEMTVVDGARAPVPPRAAPPKLLDSIRKGQLNSDRGPAGGSNAGGRNDDNLNDDQRGGMDGGAAEEAEPGGAPAPGGDDAPAPSEDEGVAPPAAGEGPAAPAEDDASASAAGSGGAAPAATGSGEAGNAPAPASETDSPAPAPAPAPAAAATPAPAPEAAPAPAAPSSTKLVFDPDGGSSVVVQSPELKQISVASPTATAPQPPVAAPTPLPAAAQVQVIDKVQTAITTTIQQEVQKVVVTPKPPQPVRIRIKPPPLQ